MTQTTQDAGEHHPPDDSGRTVLTTMLDEQRGILRWKVSGLDREQMARTIAASHLTLAGIVKHLTRVELQWFALVFAGLEPESPWREHVYGPGAEPDWEFKSALDDDPEDLLAAYDSACEHARAIVEGEPDLDRPAARPLPGWDAPPTLRWILAHMIEETARHNGHVDLLREAIDGLVGEDPPAATDD